MNATEKNLANARGEALAAHLMASAALQAVLMVLPNLQNRLDVLDSITAFIDVTLKGTSKNSDLGEFVRI